jgi:hypothetical protein
MTAVSGVAAILAMIAVCVAAVVLYFAPTFVAWMMNSRQVGAVVVINLIFGWTVLGWCVALVIALWTEKPEPQPWMPPMPPPYPYPPQQARPAQPPMWHAYETAAPPHGNPLPGPQQTTPYGAPDDQLAERRRRHMR